MKFLRFIALVLALFLFLAHRACPQENRTNTQATRQASQDSENTGAQQHYDPLAGRRHLRGGLWDNALGKINPQNKDYGECVSEWRRVAASATLENYVFWIAILMSMSLLFSLSYIYWLVHDRARRLHISVEILTQISNAYLDARDHAFDAIERHNKLADDYNVMAEKMAALEQQRAQNFKHVRGVPSDAATDEVSFVTQGSPVSADVEQHHQNVTKDSDAHVRERFANQISALQEKNKTLRNSLNEALAQLDAFKRQGMNTGA